MSEITGISDHLGGFLLRRGCPGEEAWFSPRSIPTVGSLTRLVPQPQTPPGLTTSPQASLPACPAVGLSAMRILSDGCGGIEPRLALALSFPALKSGLAAHCGQLREGLAHLAEAWRFAEDAINVGLDVALGKQPLAPAGQENDRRTR